MAAPIPARTLPALPPQPADVPWPTDAWPRGDATDLGADAARLDGLAMGGGQRRADFLLQIRDGAQRHRRAEDHFGDLLDAPLADALTARQIRQHRRQPRTDTVSPIYQRIEF